MDNLVWAEQQIRELKERVEKLERQLFWSFHFYIRPQHVDGETTDFIVTETETKLR